MATSLVRRPDLFGRLADWLDLPEFGRFGQDPQFADLIKIEQKAVDGKLEIRAEMPGIDPDKDVDISIDDDILTIKAERREEQQGEREGTTFSEFRYGSFMRSLRVPKGTSAEDVEASYKDGILTITVPAPVATKPTSFKVPISRK
jgi:HSP20 family molecular chaperone IbpA